MNLKSRQALLICDAGLEIGQGHFFRCQAFAVWLRALGWYVRILELNISSKYCKHSAIHFENTGEGRRYFLHLEQVGRLSDFALLPGALEDITAHQILVLIDSYQLPRLFYQSCIEELPAFGHKIFYLALDDWERFGAPTTETTSLIDNYADGASIFNLSYLGYPAEFFILQAGLLPVDSLPLHYLRGLEYQVLRPEFSRSYSLNFQSSDTPENFPIMAEPYCLFIPGSAFSGEQLCLTALLLKEQLPFDERLVVLLSARQVQEMKMREDKEMFLKSSEELERTEILPCLKFLANLSAVELYFLYIKAKKVFCAASQSLLEILAVRSQNIQILLTVDNQRPLLENYRLPYMDVRMLLAKRLTYQTRVQFKQIVNSLIGNQTPVKISLPSLGDGLAVERILAKMRF